MVSRERSEAVGHYDILLDKLVYLSKEELQFVISQVEEGIGDTLEFLGRVGESIPMIHSGNPGIGFSYLYNAIDVPRPLLNQWCWCEKPLEEIQMPLPKSQPFFRKDLSRSVLLEWYLVVAGREETVHYFQRNGDPKLSVSLNGPPPRDLSGLGHWLCDIEVESRKIVETICEIKGEEPVWKGVDDELFSLFPEHYGKPVSFQLEHPPTLRISDW